VQQRLTLPGSTHLLDVHASPGHDDGPGIHPGLADDELAGALASADAELVFVGHTHVSLARTAAGMRVVNLGSVCNPVTADLRASYVQLDAGERGYHIERRRVEYDRASALAALEASGNPSTPPRSARSSCAASDAYPGRSMEHDEAVTGLGGQ
jgi:hypothetical protein